VNHDVEIFLPLASWNLVEPRGPMYSRTQNDNGSYNTRCLDCFMTIASSVETEEELFERETKHVCPEKALSELLAMEKAIDADPDSGNPRHLN